MRVLITTDVEGGVWNFTLTLVRELRRLGDECLVAIVGSPSAAQLRELPRNVAWRARDLRLEWMPNSERDVEAAGEWIEQLARGWRPDVIHLNQFAYATRDLPAPTVVVAHSDVRSWWSEVRGMAAPPEWDTYAEWVRAGTAKADVLVAPTAYQSGLMARHFGRPADTVILNGIPPLSHADRLEPASRRPLVLSVGRAWDEAKGVSVLDEALDILGDEAPLAELAGPLSGPGASYQPKSLLPLGTVSSATLLRLYARTGIYVATSYYEPFGLAPLEAANSGCTLVLSDIGSFRDLWHGCAEFFPAGEPDALARVLRELLHSPERVDELAVRARERATARYTAARMGARYADLYVSLAGGTVRRRFAAGQRPAAPVTVTPGPHRAGRSAEPEVTGIAPTAAGDKPA